MRADSLITMLAASCLLFGAAPSRAEGVRQHPKGLFGQDEMLRSIRLLENDTDRLVWTLRNEAPELGVSDAAIAPIWDLFVAIENQLDTLRDEYPRLSKWQLAPRIDGLLQLDAEPEEVFEGIWNPKKPNGRLLVAWEQVRFDLRRIESLLDAKDSSRPGWMPQLAVEDRDPVKTAIVEVEELSDNLKRHLGLTEVEEADVERRVQKRKGKRRHVVVYTRFERAVLDFENAADDLKREIRPRSSARTLGSLIRELEHASRIIEHSLEDVTADDEVKREWRELRPQLDVLLRASQMEAGRR